MTKTTRKRPAPLPVRLPEKLRLRLGQAAAEAGMSRNAYAVALLSKAKPPRRKGGNVIADRQTCAETLNVLGELATAMRDIACEGLTPDQDESFEKTMQAIRDACAANMEALNRPGRSS